MMELQERKIGEFLSIIGSSLIYIQYTVAGKKKQ